MTRNDRIRIILHHLLSEPEITDEVIESYLFQINSPYKIDREKIKEVIKNSIDWSVLFSVWCNHYKNKKEYNRLREKDLDGFAEHYTKAIMKYFAGTWKPYNGGGLSSN